jgi:CheY-like chemotaxis protein
VIEGRAHVLIVDDDDDIREVLELVLGSEGYRVDVAKDGQDALHRLAVDGRPAVILLDMMMPEMDGETFMNALRCRPELAGIPVVVMSGHVAARERASALAAAACLVKPVEIDDLLRVVQRLAPA